MHRWAAAFSFAVTYAIIAVLSQAVVVYVFDYWEWTLGTQHDNMMLTVIALPFLVGLGLPLFVVALQISATFRQFDRRAATKVGVLSALLTITAIVLATIVDGIDTAAAPLLLMVGPGLAAIVVTIAINGIGRSSWNVDMALEDGRKKR